MSSGLLGRLARGALGEEGGSRVQAGRTSAGAWCALLPAHVGYFRASLQKLVRTQYKA